MRMLLFVVLTIPILVSAAPAPKSSAGDPIPKPDTFGIGAVIGTMGSINAKYYVFPGHSFDVGVEYLDQPWAVFYADYHMGFRDFYGTRGRFAKQTLAYFGVGVGAGFWTREEHCGRWHCKWEAKSTGAGNGFLARVLFGSEWFSTAAPVSAFAELGPTYMMYPSNGNTFEAVLGGRFYF